MSEQAIKLTDVVGSHLCIAADDGEKVYAAIAAAIREGDRVRLSFDGVEDLTSAFLNAAIGQLYGGEFSDALLRASLLPPIHALPDDLLMLKRVVERAKEFFKDPDRFVKAEREVLGDVD